MHNFEVGVFAGKYYPTVANFLSTEVFLIYTPYNDKDDLQRSVTSRVSARFRARKTGLQKAKCFHRSNKFLNDHSFSATELVLKLTPLKYDDYLYIYFRPSQKRKENDK